MLAAAAAAAHEPPTPVESLLSGVAEHMDISDQRRPRDLQKRRLLALGLLPPLGRPVAAAARAAAVVAAAMRTVV